MRVDDNGSAVAAFASIPVKAGVIDYFDIGINNRTNPTPNDVLTDIPDFRAGSLLPNVTVVARDVFGNHVNDYAENVTLYVNHGSGILNPVSIDLGDGLGSGTYQGSWRGPIQITRTGTDIRLYVREDTYANTDSSNTFVVFAEAQDYADLIVLLPGETHTPGIAPGKVGTPLPVAAGDPVVATVIATDAWWNQVPVQPQIHFTSDNYFQMITANDTPLDPDGPATSTCSSRRPRPTPCAAADLITPAIEDVSTIEATPATLDRLMVLLPGEASQPGGPEPDGKIGTPCPADLQPRVRCAYPRGRPVLEPGEQQQRTRMDRQQRQLHHADKSAQQRPVPRLG